MKKKNISTKTNIDQIKKNDNQKPDNQRDPDQSEQASNLDPMGTEVMQEDDYQIRKHGELPADNESASKNTDNKREE